MAWVWRGPPLLSAPFPVVRLACFAAGDWGKSNHCFFVPLYRDCPLCCQQLVVLRGSESTVRFPPPVLARGILAAVATT